MEKSVQNKVKIVVIAIAMIVMARNSISLIISHIIQAFPEQSVTTCQFVFTSFSGVAFFGSLLFGVLASKMTKKHIAILALAMIFTGATIAILFGSTSIGMLFVSSIIIGIGLGMITPLIAAIISDYFGGPERAKMVGMQTIASTLAGFVYPVVAGYLVAINWVYDYFVFYVTIPILLIVLFLLPAGKVAEAPKSGEKVKVWSPPLICWVIQVFLFGICWITFNSNLTTLFKGLGYENFVQLSSYVTLVFTFGTLIPCLILSKLCTKFGKPLMSYGLAMTTVGLFLLSLARTPATAWLTFVAGGLIGFSFGPFLAAAYVFIPQTLEPRTISKGLSYFSAANLLGGFINPYVITATAGMINSSVYTKFLIAAVLCLANTIFAFATGKITNPPSLEQ